MNIVIAPNTFKECLSAPKVAQAIAEGVLSVKPDANCIKIPLADGGDGTVDAMVSSCNGEMIELTVNDPLMRPIKARYGIINDGTTAVIEMAEASGLRLLQEDEKNPLHTTTYGTGELMIDAITRGVTKIIIGIGGSATTDLGIGMAAALGYRFLDQSGEELKPIGESLNLIAKIDTSNVSQSIQSTEISVACDVKNPLVGKNGAAPVYGPQKGASPEIVKQLDDGLFNTANCMERDLSIRVHDTPGGGAAGGLGAGLLAFCNANIHSGFDLIADITQLEKHIKQASLVITGEGIIDQSTKYGKVPHGVARTAKKYNIPVVVLTGKIGQGISELHQDGITALFTIQDGPQSLEDSIHNAAELLSQITSQVLRLWLAKN